MADTPSVAVQAPPGYGRTELFHLPLVALASKGEVKYVSVLQSHDSQNFIEEGYGGGYLIVGEIDNFETADLDFDAFERGEGDCGWREDGGVCIHGCCR